MPGRDRLELRPFTHLTPHSLRLRRSCCTGSDERHRKPTHCYVGAVLELTPSKGIGCDAVCCGQMYEEERTALVGRRVMRYAWIHAENAVDDAEDKWMAVNFGDSNDADADVAKMAVEALAAPQLCDDSIIATVSARFFARSFHKYSDQDFFTSLQVESTFNALSPCSDQAWCFRYVRCRHLLLSKGRRVASSDSFPICEWRMMHS